MNNAVQQDRISTSPHATFGWRDLFFLALALIAFCVMMIDVVPSDRFGYDESDYLYAATRGVRANYMDKPSIPFSTFIELGMQHGRDSTQRTSLSEFIRSSDDITAYRHYHAPMVYYYVAILVKIVGTNEYAIRWGTLLFLMATAIVAYIGLLHFGGTSGRYAGIIAAALLLSSVVPIEAALKISPHSLFCLLSCTALYLLARFLAVRRAALWYATLAVVCAAFATLEYSSMLIATVIIMLWLKRRSLFEGWTKRQVAGWITRSMLFFVSLFTMLWVGGVVKLTVVKNFIFLAYFAFMRNDSVGTQSAISVWFERIALSPMLYASILIAVGLFLYHHFKHRRYEWLLPFGVFAGLMFLTTVGNRSPHSTYVSSLHVSLFIITAGVLGDRIHAITRRDRGGILLLVLVALLANNLHHFAYRPTDDVYRAQVNTLVAYFDRQQLHREHVLIPRDFLPNLHFYFPEASLPSYRIEEPVGAIATLAIEKQPRAMLYTGRIARALEAQLGAEFFAERRTVFHHTDSGSTIYYSTLRAPRE